VQKSFLGSATSFLENWPEVSNLPRKPNWRRPIQWRLRSVEKSHRDSENRWFYEKYENLSSGAEIGGRLIRRGAALNSEACCDRLDALIRGTVFLIGTFCLPFLAFQGIVCRFLLGCTRWLGC
jgi:hypothetical protein